jgi:magnesium chelatase subunit D
LSEPRTARDSAWPDASLALCLFAIDPLGTGVSLRSPAGPVRTAWLDQLRDALPKGLPRLKMPASISDEALLGGLDFSASLSQGRKVMQAGLLARAEGGIVMAVMAERLPQGTAALLTAALDGGQTSCRFGLLALDEGLTDEILSPALQDRVAFLIDLSEVSHHDFAGVALPDAAQVAAARQLLPAVQLDDEVLQALCGTAAALGAGFVRAPLLAMQAARCMAAFSGRTETTMEDAAVAARLVLAPRATRFPSEPESSAEQTPPDQQPSENEAKDDTQDGPPEGADMVLEAAKAAIPAGLLEKLMRQDFSRPGRAGAGKMGARQKAGQLGRPVGVRAAAPSSGLRLNLIETLRAAAPWQRLRAAEPRLGGPRIRLQKSDFRVTRTEQRARTVTIFLVDASGSSAINRLAEAKGAVELLLADCYQRRDEVAVLAFRGKAADLLLPPTRSLVRAKRSLSGLPGGGGTPLAAGIDAGFLLAERVRRVGDTPTLVLLTDGRANVTLAGTGGRAQAEQEAMQAARRVRSAGHSALFLDISPRPAEQGRRLAQEMGALYLPLPYADATRVSKAVRDAVLPR